MPVSILVGSNLLASHLRVRLAGQGRAAANLRFYTFLDLATRLAELATEGAGQMPRIPKLGAPAILENILTEHPPAIFAPVCGFAGFKDAVLGTFRDLRDAGVGPRALDEGVRRCAHDDPVRHEHLLGLAEVYRRFRAAAGLFHDVDDDFRAAAGAARVAPAALGSPVLLIYGIYDVTGQQSDLLTALKSVLELRYFVPFVNDEVSAFARPFVTFREGELGVAAEQLEELPVPGSLHGLNRRDFGLSLQAKKERKGNDDDNQAPAADGSFSLVSTPGDSRSAIETVREIFSAVRDGIISGFHEAAVILRQPEEQAPILAEALRLRNIPYFLEGGSPFLSRPLGQAVIALTGLEPAAFSRRSILHAMELVAAALPDAGSQSWEVQEWRALTNDPRFLSGESAWDAGTKALVRKAESDLRDSESGVTDEEERRTISLTAAKKRHTSALALRAAWAMLRQAAAGWTEPLSWSDWARLLQSRLEPLLGTCEDWGRFSSVLDSLASLSEAAARIGIEPCVSRVRFVSALAESFSALCIAEGRFLRTGVNLLSPAAARGLRFPLVIVPGLDEGRFPARLRQDPLLLDLERSRIGTGRLPLKAQRGDEEKLLFDMAARSAERRLVLMTSRLDESSDRERIPSEFFLRAAAAARGAPAAVRDLVEGGIPGLRSVGLDNPAPAGDLIPVDDAEIRLRLLTARPGSSRSVLAALEKEEPDLLRGPIAYDRARWLPRLTPFDGKLTSPDLVRAVAAKVGPAAGQVSASRLEAYAKCPYLFYLRRVIGLEGWEEEEAPERMNPLDRGQAVHEILERFLGDFAGEKFASTPVDILRQCLDQQSSAVLDMARPIGMPDLLWEIEKEKLVSVLRNWLEFEKGRAAMGYLPVCFERSFGRFHPEDEGQGIRLQAGSHLFVFRGRIDRVDLSRDRLHARVIDYKTGILPKTMGGEARLLLMGGEKIQVALYRGALALLEGFSQVEGVEGEYLHLQPRDGRIVSCAYSDELLEKAYDLLPALLEIIGDGLESGRFFARTKGTVYPDGHCTYCDFLPVCGRDREQREERKAADPAVARFLRILEIDEPPHIP